jgi:hypothetical protein
VARTFASQTSEGVRNTPDYCLAAAGRAGAAAGRIRLPRRWDAGRAVTRFDAAAAAAAALLGRLAREQARPRLAVNDSRKVVKAWSKSSRRAVKE